MITEVTKEEGVFQVTGGILRGDQGVPAHSGGTPGAQTMPGGTPDSHLGTDPETLATITHSHAQGQHLNREASAETEMIKGVQGLGEMTKGARAPLTGGQEATDSPTGGQAGEVRTTGDRIAGAKEEEEVPVTDPQIIEITKTDLHLLTGQDQGATPDFIVQNVESIMITGVPFVQDIPLRQTDIVDSATDRVTKSFTTIFTIV